MVVWVKNFGGDSLADRCRVMMGCELLFCHEVGGRCVMIIKPVELGRVRLLPCYKSRFGKVPSMFRPITPLQVIKVKLVDPSAVLRISLSELFVLPSQCLHLTLDAPKLLFKVADRFFVNPR